MAKKDPNDQFHDIQKNVEEYMKAFDKGFKEGTFKPNSTIIDPETGLLKFSPESSRIESQVPLPEFSQSKYRFRDFFADMFTASIEGHQWSRFSNVRGHWRTSVNGNVHFVNSHSRYTGDFWDWFAWTPLSWLAFPAIFIYMQLHSEGSIGFVILNLFIAGFGACLADAALVLGLVAGFLWVLLKIIS